MFAARKTDGATAAGPATYIEDVFSTYLYTGNGSIQTIPNGIALGSAYGGSVYFDGTSDYLRTASTTAAAFGTGDFTMEVWANPTTTPSTYRGILSTYDGSTGAIIEIINGEFAFWVGTHTLSGVTATLGSWAHLALTRSGTTVRFFVNGVLRNTELAHTTNYSSSPITVGAIDTSGAYDFNGYTSNARIIKGTALYTSTFTPPTVPLTAVSGTSFLTCQSPNPITDYSSNALSITVNGNAVAQNGGGPFTDSTANKGGMVWLKGRSGATDHALYDTARGATFDLVSNSTAAQTTQTTGLTSFNANGFSIGSLAKLNTNGATYASWTFRKQAKFFDVVTYTGTGTARTVSHNLGSVPGMIIVKRNGAIGEWNVYHRSLATNQYLTLESTAAVSTSASYWNNTAPTSTEFSVSSVNNTSSNTYVAYLFAHNAGGFGAAGTDNVISCGSYTGNASSSGPVVTLGYEPQWVLIKGTTAATQQWFIFDTMRGIVTESSVSIGEDPYLLANTSAAETSSGISWLSVTSTGFQIMSGNSNLNGNGENYIYIAIRRGPMKTPTSGTSVFFPLAVAQADSLDTSTVPFPPDLVNTFSRNGTNRTATFDLFQFLDRLRGLGIPSTTFVGGSAQLVSSSTSAEASAANSAYLNLLANSQDITRATGWNTASYGNWINYFWRRAPGFFDVVCYTGTGNNTTVSHNLSVVPELCIFKRRNTTADWLVHAPVVGANSALYLNLTNASATISGLITLTSGAITFPTAGAQTSATGSTYVAYLFASVTGVSKVGSYTGNGSSQTINCGFTAGARFILIKRYDSTGDWYVWDTARGIVSGNDPHLSLNTTAAEVTTDDSIDPDNSGFIVNQLAATNINVNAASYIFLAVS